MGWERLICLRYRRPQTCHWHHLRPGRYHPGPAALTCLYGPEAFGFLALFTSITSIIGVIACMHYEMRIMLPKTDEETANLPALCLLSVAVISGLTVPALYFGGDALLPLLRAPGPGSYPVLVSPFVFAGGCFLR